MKMTISTIFVRSWREEGTNVGYQGRCSVFVQSE